MKWMRATIVGLGVGLTLACGGSGEGEAPTDKPNPDIADPAERARLRGEYPRAEQLLKARIRADPTDHHAYRLLGDVNLTRGQHYTKKWKENLTRAFENYATAVTMAPDECTYWGRVASSVEMASMLEDVRIPRENLENLPLEEGWKNCASAALLSTHIAVMPTAEELRVAEAKFPDASVGVRFAEAAPWIREAWARAPFDQVRWSFVPEPAPVSPGSPFVVLEPPVQAVGIGHQFSRPVKSIEKFIVSRVKDGRAVFVDRRFPQLVPKQGLVLAPACKYTQWKDAGDDQIPTGTCTTGEYLRSKSPVYNPDRLNSAGPAHFTHASIKPSIVPADEIHTGSVKCLGGTVGKKLEYTASCMVGYDKPNWMTRGVPLDKTRGARDDVHAEQMMEAARLEPVWGEDLTRRAVNGQIGVGIPYALFFRTLPDTKGCQGRGILAKHQINGGQIEFTCVLDNLAYTFIDLQLVHFAPLD